MIWACHPETDSRRKEIKIDEYQSMIPAILCLLCLTIEVHAQKFENEICAGSPIDNFAGE